MNPVSVIIITYNEEENIKRCLRNLAWSDEIIIVDSGSTDKTIEICKQYNCKIFHKTFRGYGLQKRYAVSLAKNDWILSLDADEVLTTKVIGEIKNKMMAPDCNGYLIPMEFVFMGQHFAFGRESGKYFLRLFNKQFGNFTNAKVHESVEVTGKVGKLKHRLLHYSYRNFQQLLDKVSKYSTYSAEESYKKGKKKSTLAIIGGLPYNFIRLYIFNANFLNGLNGFYWSVFGAYYHFVKYIKLNEMYKKQISSTKEKNTFPERNKLVVLETTLYAILCSSHNIDCTLFVF